MQTADLTEALNTLKHKTEPIPRYFLQEIQSLLLPRTGSLTARQTSDLLHSCAKLKYYDRDLILGLTQGVLQGKSPVHEFDNRGLSTVIYSLGQLKALSKDSPMPGEVLQLIKVILKELKEDYRKQYFESRQISNILHGLALLKLASVDEVLFLVELGFQEQYLSNFTEQGFCNFLHSLKELKFKLTPQFQTQLISELKKTERLEGLSQQGLCNVMSSLKSLEIEDQSLLESLAECSVLPNQLNSYNSQDLANLVYTISTWTISNKTPVLEAFKNRILELKNLSKMKEQELSVLVYCLAQSRVQELDSILKFLGQEVIQSSRLFLYTNQGLSMLIYSFGVAKFKDLSILRVLSKEFVKPYRLESASNQSLSNVVYGLGRFRIIKDPVLNTVITKLLNEAQRGHRLKSCNEQFLTNIIYSLAQLKLGQFLEPFLTEVLKIERISRLTDQGLSNIFQSLHWLEQSHGSRSIIEEAIKRSAGSGLSPAAALNFLNIGLSTTTVQNQASFRPLLRALLTKQRLTEFSNDGLISILLRSARAEFRERKIVLPVVLELTSVSRRTGLSVLQMSAALRLSWILGLSGNQVIDKLVTLLLSKDQWQELTSNALAEVLISLCWLNYPDQSLYSLFCQKLVFNLQQVDPEKIVQIVRGLRVGWVPLDFVESFLDHLCAKEQLESLNLGLLVSLVQSQATFHLRDPTRVERCLEEVIKPSRISQITVKDTSILLEALIQLDLKDQPQIPTLVSIVDDSKALEMIRVHYVAKMVICLAQLGQEYKSKTGKLVEWLVRSPRSESLVEKDLMDMLTTLKEADYEYGKIGRLLNQKRQSKSDEFEDIAI